jgi:hypothetical protein
LRAGRLAVFRAVRPAFRAVFRAVRAVLRATFRAGRRFAAVFRAGRLAVFRAARPIFRAVFRAVRAVLRAVLRAAGLRAAVLRAVFRLAAALRRAGLLRAVVFLVVRFFPVVAIGFAPILFCDVASTRSTDAYIGTTLHLVQACCPTWQVNYFFQYMLFAPENGNLASTIRRTSTTNSF